MFASKLIALALGCAVFSAIMAAVAIAVPALLVQLHHGAAVDHLASLIATGGRGVGITVALAAVGFCFGLLFRHTVAAVGIALGYFLIVFVRSAILGSVAWAVRLTPWTPEANLLAVAQKGYHYQSAMDGSSSGNADATEPVIHTVSLEHGLLYLGVGLVVLLALTLFVFRRRDVG